MEITRYYAGLSATLDAKAPPEPHMIFSDWTLFGMFAVGLILFCYPHENHRRDVALVGAIGGLLAAIYAVATPVWPMSGVAVVWSIASLIRWRKQLARHRFTRSKRKRGSIAGTFDGESRFGRTSGPLN